MIHQALRIIQFIAILGCGSAAVYYVVCMWSAAAFRRMHTAPVGHSANPLPPVSILKPLKGTDPNIYESFRSHCLQDFPECEIIFGVSDPADPAVASVERLQREFPNHAIRLVVCSQVLGPNVKVSNLAQMVGFARNEHLIVNDSDIGVESDYLRSVIAPLTDQQVGMVTCLYRGVATATLGSWLEALGISSDFCAGVLVARQIEGGLRFGLGSTLAFRRTDLDRIGGFAALVDFLADDYELGRRISELDKRVVLSDVVVETHLPAYDMRGFMDHQLRWFRGVRDARRKGYIGMASTFGVMWSLLALIASAAAPWALAMIAAMLGLRMVMAFAMCRVLNDKESVGRLWLLPVRDLIAAAIWVVSLAGHTVTWRGDRFELKNGRLIRIPL